MQAQERRHSARWAPWWLYVIALVVTNQVRTRWLMPEELATWLDVLVGVGSMGLVAALVTAVWRVTRT